MKNNLPKISIVIPSYNQGVFLQYALESIFSQMYPNLEVIVMDGGSNDQSLDIIRSYSEKLKYWQSQPDEGQANAINMGMQYCNGDIVSWLNSDDWYINNPFWVIARAYQENPKSGLFIGNGFRHKDGEFRPFCPRHVAISREVLSEGLDYILQPATFMSRDAWLQSGGLNTELHYGLDWDLFIRILEKHSAVTINEFLAVSREYEQTKTSSGHLVRARELIEIASNNTSKKEILGQVYYLMSDSIYEFLAMSNELSTSRVIPNLPNIQQELLSIIAQSNRQTITLGSFFYLMETLLSTCVDEAGYSENIRSFIYATMQKIQQEMKKRWDTPDPFPIESDTQDKTFIPFARGTERFSEDAQGVKLFPVVSIIIPSYNQADFLSKTIESIINQKYPLTEIIVYDGGSTDGSVDILRKYAQHLAYWQSEKDEGPSHAINKGFTKATGEIIGWLNSDDVLTEGALWSIVNEFIQNPETEVVFGNALYIDEQDNLFLANHGTHRTGLYYGKLEAITNVPFYWTYIHAIPQPTVYFRRHLIEKTGNINQSYHYIFDFEFFWRLRKVASFKKIEKTLALYRIHSRSKTSDWNKFLRELFRFSQPLWPERNTIEYQTTITSLINHYFPNHSQLIKQIIKLCVEYKITSPEKIGAPFYVKKIVFKIKELLKTINNRGKIIISRLKALVQHISNKKAPIKNIESLQTDLLNVEHRESPKYDVLDREKKYTITFCGFHYPFHPGYSGGEIRDFHILRKLLEISSLDFFALWSAPKNNRDDNLRSYFRTIYEPDILNSYLPHRIDINALKMDIKTRALLWTREKNIPILGPIYHHDSHRFVFANHAYVIPSLSLALKVTKPDFLFIGPQLNPLPLQTFTVPTNTRLILSSYDVEAIRLERMAASRRGLAKKALQLEARRASVFERDTLEYYDGIIAVSETDKQSYIQRYQFDSDRILVLDNSVDTEYFSYQPRIETDQPNIVFIGSLGYWPNHEAAQLLLKDIMPLVRKQIPNARAWIVGQSPGRELLELSDGILNIVTGQVDDVRCYLDIATAACIPLRTGSGTKYKVLEGASAGVPIICTPLALEGLSLEPNNHVLVGQSNQELADAIIKVVKFPKESQIQVQKAAAHIEKYYSWNSNLQKLPPWLETIQHLPRRKFKE
ncbi:MAG: glycosyltransferase [Anaerolineales bacterium]|nr:glycosyltransferase [Anaerolineales bacterium]